MSAEVSVLFDAPGPKARLRYNVIAVVGGLLIAALLVLLSRALAAKDQFIEAKWAPFLEPATWTAYLLPGLRATLVAAFFSVILAVVFGILLGMGRLSQLAGVRWACGVFVEFFRAVPVLMMMLFAYYVFLFGFQISGDYLSLYGVIAGLTFYNSSVIAELIRSGVGALPTGQREAGLAIGLTPFQTLRTISVAAGHHADAALDRQPAGRCAQGLRPRVPHPVPGAASAVGRLSPPATATSSRPSSWSRPSSS